MVYFGSSQQTLAWFGPRARNANGSGISLVIFTENADNYNLNKQLQFFSESKIVKVNSQENFSALDFAIKEVVMLNGKCIVGSL